ncbi:MAG: phage tail protein I [Acutalibacteraceae bacterium]
MSKIGTGELIKMFPHALSGDDRIVTLAAVVAEAMMKLYGDNNRLLIFSMIDNLDGNILDVLAKDFKVEWWDYNATVEEKRAVFKTHFDIHRRLGTPGAIKDAISSIYDSAEIVEWFKYSGLPFHYKINIELGNGFIDYNKFDQVLRSISIYTNLRSVLDKVNFNAERRTQLFVGLALQYCIQTSFVVSGVDEAALTWFVDENENMLCDESGIVLFE